MRLDHIIEWIEDSYKTLAAREMTSESDKRKLTVERIQLTAIKAGQVRKNSINVCILTVIPAHAGIHVKHFLDIPNLGDQCWTKPYTLITVSKTAPGVFDIPSIPGRAHSNCSCIA